MITENEKISRIRGGVGVVFTIDPDHQGLLLGTQVVTSLKVNRFGVVAIERLPNFT